MLRAVQLFLQGKSGNTVYTDESKTTLDHISARYELQGGCVLRFLADYDRTIDLIIDDSNDLQFLECDNRYNTFCRG